MRVKVNFHKCIYDSPDFGSDDQRVVSRIFCTMEAKDEIFREVSVDVRQLRSPRGPAEEPLEVGKPRGYSGPMKQEKFAEVVKAYYRSLTRQTIRISKKGKSVRVSKVIAVPGFAEFDA